MGVLQLPLQDCAQEVSKTHKRLYPLSSLRALVSRRCSNKHHHHSAVFFGQTNSLYMILAILHTAKRGGRCPNNNDIALRISLSSAPFGLPLWASLSAFSRFVINTEKIHTPYSPSRLVIHTHIAIVVCVAPKLRSLHFAHPV